MTDILTAVDCVASYPKRGFHAMDILLIVERVVSFLEFAEVSRCAQVSKQWNRNFMPFLWRHPTSTRDWFDRQQQITKTGVEKYGQYIESLKVAESTPHHSALVKHAIHLKQLAVHFLDPHRKFPITSKVQLIQRNQRLERLVLIQGWFNWPNLTCTSHPHLKHLVLQKCQIERHYTQPFWELVTNLESLELIQTALPAVNFKPTEWTFRHLRVIALRRFPPLRRWHMRARMLCDWIGQCPNLYKLRLEPERAYTVPGGYLAKVIRQNRIPLKAFDINACCRITEDDLDALIDASDGLSELKVNRWMSLGTATCARLLTQCNTLTRVCLRQGRVTVQNVRTEVFIPSAYLQQILSTCPNLLEFYGGVLDAADMMQSPWVCSKLRVLVLFIMPTDSLRQEILHHELWTRDFQRIRQPGISPSKSHKGRNRYRRHLCQDPRIRAMLLEHASIFERLSRLADLEELDLTQPSTYYGPMSHSLCMRFICGFGKLGRLRKLRVVGCHSVFQIASPSEHEMNWIAGYKQYHNKSNDPLQQAQVDRQAPLVAAKHRPWLLLERLRWATYHFVVTHHSAYSTPLYKWRAKVMSHCKNFEIDMAKKHPSCEGGYLYPVMIQVPPEPEPPLTDDETNGDLLN
ncbi:hypothetical protein BGZ73_001619 [Actinomortierella ambigua]|nr:hypothetical protein BGZ73_001619 [Actinomortierella ambigua]